MKGAAVWLWCGEDEREVEDEEPSFVTWVDQSSVLAVRSVKIWLCYNLPLKSWLSFATIKNGCFTFEGYCHNNLEGFRSKR